MVLSLESLKNRRNQDFVRTLNIMKQIAIAFSSQWSNYGSDFDIDSVNDLENNSENIYLNEYENCFDSDSEIESVSEFHIDSAIESDILSLILGKNEHQILLQIRSQIYPQRYGGNTTLPFKRIRYNSK